MKMEPVFILEYPLSEAVEYAIRELDVEDISYEDWDTCELESQVLDIIKDSQDYTDWEDTEINGGYINSENNLLSEIEDQLNEILAEKEEKWYEEHPEGEDEE